MGNLVILPTYLDSLPAKTNSREFGDVHRQYAFYRQQTMILSIYIYMQTLNSTNWGTYFHISRMIMGMQDVMWKGKHLQDTKYNLFWCVWSKNRLPGS